MRYDVKVPSAGESVTEAFIGPWKKRSGDMVKKGDVIVDLESQKATFELEAEASGRLEILKPNEGDRVSVGEVIATIDDSATDARPPSPQPSPHLSAGRQVKGEGAHLGPAVRRRAAEVPPVQPAAPAAESPPTRLMTPAYIINTARGERAEKASRIRKQIAQNLVAAQHNAAILTTFNEIDMSKVMELRGKYKDAVLKKHGIKLGVVGPFAMAVKRALLKYPLVNSTFTGEEIIKRDFLDLSVAVSSDRGLVVPVIRDLQTMDWIAFEKKLAEVAEKARAGKLSIPEMSGGTFTITNGGVFGSLIATPLLNLNQSAILGLHKIEERPVAIKGKVEIRPMMYVALSYDHRLLDGKDSVEFLIAIKEGMEDPSLVIDDAIFK